MPQPRTANGAEASRRDQVAKLLDPLGLVVLTREKVLETFEDAVQRGRMTRDDAQELAGVLISRSRQNADDLLGDLEQLLGRQRAGARTAATASRKPGAGARLPIEDYDDLTAAQITARLADLTPEQLRRVGEHERRNANRKSVLQAVARKLG